MIQTSPQNIGECLIESVKYLHEYLTFDIPSHKNPNNVYAIQSVTIKDEDTIKWELIEEDFGLGVYFLRNKISDKYLCAIKDEDYNAEHSVELIDFADIAWMSTLDECRWRIFRHVSKSGLSCQVINNVYYDQNLAARSIMFVNAINSRRNVYLTNIDYVSENSKWFLEF